jgi:hypothetical protein
MASYLPGKDRLYCDRLVFLVKEGTKILVKDRIFPDRGWFEATYSMRKWPFDDDAHDPVAGYLCKDEFFGENVWRPILRDDEVRIL